MYIDYVTIKNQYKRLGGAFLKTVLVKNVPKSTKDPEFIKS